MLFSVKTDTPAVGVTRRIAIQDGRLSAAMGQLPLRLGTRDAVDVSGAKVFEGMGVYAPTLGIIGAVLGLMAVMQNLEDPSKLGAGIAAAFTATIYGIGLANLLMLPAAAKLKEIANGRAHVRGLIIDGLAAIAEGENPRIIEAKLQGYLVKD